MVEVKARYAMRSMERLAKYLSLPPKQIPHILIDNELRILKARIEEWREIK